MVTYNRLQFTKKVIEHLIERTTSPFRLIIVDNASSDGTMDYLNKIKADTGLIKRLIPSKINLGLQAAKNLGLEYVESNYFVDTDNDCLCPKLDPDWLARLRSFLDQYPDFAAIALRPQVLVGVGPIFKDAKEIVENNLAGGSFRIMRTQLVREVGGWVNDFENRREEWEICGKLRRKGFKVGYTRDIFTYHMFGENWGYDENIPHYHNQASRVYAKDAEYDPITMEPLKHNNE